MDKTSTNMSLKGPSDMGSPKNSMFLPNDPIFDVSSSTPRTIPSMSNFYTLTQNTFLYQNHQLPSYRPIMPYVYEGKRVPKVTYYDALTAKLARCRRKLARQRSLILKSNPELYPSNNVATTDEIINQKATHDSSLFKVDKSLYQFSASDNKMFRMLLTKELKASDVGSLGRIILPKREAEYNLPPLHDREGIQLMIINLHTRLQWCMKYKYWINNKSRMYVFEYSGDFVKENGLEIGDSVTLHEDECKNIYFSIEKGEGSSSFSAANPTIIDLDPDPVHEDMASETLPREQEAYPSEIMPTTHDQATTLEIAPSTLPSTHEASIPRDLSMPISSEDWDEEDASLALLIEQLRPREEQDDHNLFNLGLDKTNSPQMKFNRVEEGSFNPPAN